MARNVGKEEDEHPDVGGHHAARHRREAAGHDRHQLGHRHAADERLDQQRRLGLAEEDVARGRERFRAGRAHGAHHHPGHALHHPLHHAEVVQQRHERREEDDRRQHVEGEERARLRRVARQRLDRRVRSRGPGADRHVVPHQVAEQEARALHRVAEQRDHDVVDAGEERAARRRTQDEQREDELQARPPEHDAPRHRAPVHAQQPPDEQQHDHPEHGDEPLPQGRIDLAPGLCHRRARLAAAPLRNERGRRIQRRRARAHTGGRPHRSGVLKGLSVRAGRGAGQREQQSRAGQHGEERQSRGHHHPAPRAGRRPTCGGCCRGLTTSRGAGSDPARAARGAGARPRACGSRTA